MDAAEDSNQNLDLCAFRIYDEYRLIYLHEISNNVVYITSKASDQPAHTRSLIRTFASRLNIF